MAHHLILGGARSGKSSFAEKEVISLGLPRVYIATAEAGDNEMNTRIQQHKNDREVNWRLIEEPLDLAGALNQVDSSESVLIDCLTLWLSNCLHQDEWPLRKQAFLNALKNCTAHVVLVSNEVGYGITPIGELSRQFIDDIGWLHQELAQHCTRVTLVIAGLATDLKSD